MGVNKETGFLHSKEVMIPVPVCTFQKGITKDKYNGFMSWGFKESTTEVFQLPQFDLKMDFDEGLHLIPKVTESDSNYQGRLEFSPADIASGKKSELNLSYLNNGIISHSYKTIVQDYLPPCH